eukprot:GFUD01085873.1.p1 GENE.GFUD01085873.1~~GFUD01085873.1.p1  ORF type:complete len:450 (+),score=118.05 GFUD01085873.1:121-1470(+)
MRELRELREGKHGVVMGLVPWVLTGAVLAGVLVVGVLQHVEMERIRERLQKLEGEMIIVRDLVYKDTSIQYERNRRAADSLSPSQYSVENPLKENYSEYSEDGVPVVDKKYRSFRKDRTGFRVYNAWYQHKRENEIKNDPRVVVKHATDAPIRAHHRKSAAWSSNDDDFLEFGDSMYSDTSVDKRNINPVSNTINYSRNRDYRNKNLQATIGTTTVPPSEAPAVALNEHMRDKMRGLNSTQTSQDRRRQPKTQERSRTGGGVSLKTRGARNRGAVRSGVRKRRLRSRNAVEYKKNMRDAIHLEADVTGLDGPDYEGAGRVRVADSVFRNWTPSRWAKRMKMDKRLTLKDGRITVGSPGVYFVYAQINYLDNHDVNAFQIVVNDSPFLLCTTMTHTPHHTTKANTCYTGGVKFLEQGDTIFIKNLEENRFSVMLPSHSFFGLAQLSDMGI